MFINLFFQLGLSTTLAILTAHRAWFAVPRVWSTSLSSPSGGFCPGRSSLTTTNSLKKKSRSPVSAAQRNAESSSIKLKSERRKGLHFQSQPLCPHSITTFKDCQLSVLKARLRILRLKGASEAYVCLKVDLSDEFSIGRPEVAFCQSHFLSLSLGLLTNACRPISAVFFSIRDTLKTNLYKWKISKLVKEEIFRNLFGIELHALL